MRYPVTITADDNGTFLVTFPDVPDAVTYGDTIDEALAHAPEALLTVFDAYMKDRRDIPDHPSYRADARQVPIRREAIVAPRLDRHRSIRRSGRTSWKTGPSTCISATRAAP